MNNPPPTSQLADAIERRASALRDQALAHGGEVDAAELAALERLARLAELGGRRRKRWPMLALFAATLAVLSLLLFVRIGDTRVILDLEVSELGFELSEEQAATRDVALASLGTSGLARIEGPAELGRRIGAVRLAALDERSSITLERATLPAGTRLRLQAVDVVGNWRLSIATSRPPALRASLLGTVSIEGGGTPATAKLAAASPTALHLVGEHGALDFSLTMRDPTQPLLQLPLVVRGLLLHDTEQQIDGTRTRLRRSSTLLGGTVVYDELGGKALPLRAGEWLRFAASDGVLRVLESQPHKLHLQFDGVVRDMSRGVDRRSLMPTWLEWLAARHGLVLLWGSTFYLFGLAVGALRWWGVRL
jgi:hypothetical protein